MIAVAVAGGNGDLGKAIVQALLREGNHQVFILSRKPPISSDDSGAQVLVVNYGDVPGTAQTLESHGIGTVISTLSILGQSEQAQLDLIAAASRSSSTKRFIPSEWSGYLGDSADEKSISPIVLPLIRACKALAETQLETTRVANGLFLDYWGFPHISTTLRYFAWAVDIANRRAAIPGTGNELFTVTYSKDVARFVIELVSDKTQWPVHSNVSGSDTCLNEVVAMAEEVIGEKLNVHYDSVDDIRAGKATPVSPVATYGGEDSAAEAAMVGALTLDGGMLVPQQNRLNNLYPGIKPLGIKEFLVKAWGDTSRKA